jgi:hypothetical protein
MSKPKRLYLGTCCVCGEQFEAILWKVNEPPKLCKKPECKNKLSSITMARTNRVHASARMVSNNPMHRDGSLEKMKKTLKRIGHKPVVRGGNGCGATRAEEALSNALGWPMQVVVRTNMPRVSGYPSCYKIDVANPSLKVGVEVDGSSHTSLSRKAQDTKKDAFLRGLGWIVLRVSNRQALEALSSTISRLKALIPTSPTAP